MSSKNLILRVNYLFERVPLLLQAASSDVKAYTVVHCSLPRRKNSRICSLTAE
jgi:hypothetical protein